MWAAMEAAREAKVTSRSDVGRLVSGRRRVSQRRVDGRDDLLGQLLGVEGIDDELGHVAPVDSARRCARALSARAASHRRLVAHAH